MTKPSRDYRIRGFRVPGVTDVTGMLDKPELTRWKTDLAARTGDRDAGKKQGQLAADRGTRVHDAALLLAQGKRVLGGPSDSATDTCVANIAAWMKQHVAEVLLCEQPVYHRAYLYAGRPDLLCVIRGRQGVFLLDWKASGAKAVYPEWRLQLGAYAICDEVRKVAGHRTVHAAVMLCDPTGDCTPHMHEVEDLRSAGNVFLHLLSVWNWRKSLTD